MSDDGTRMELVRDGFGMLVVGAGDGGGDLRLRHIIGVGRNYAEHAHEQGANVPERPMLFCKSSMSAIGSGEEIVVPRVCQNREQVDFEGELAVVIGRSVRDISEDDALGCVLGYCVANDVSARWWQKEGAGGQFHRGKSFDTFCPLGPWVTPARKVEEMGGPQGLRVRTQVSGEVMQDSPTSEMIFSVAGLIAEISRGTTIVAGTVILTGTPSGVGMSREPKRFLRDGDMVEIKIGGLGALRNAVRFEA